MNDETKNKWEDLANKDVSSEEFEMKEASEPENEEIPLSQGLEHPDYQALQDTLTETEQNLHDQREANARILAELDNLRKRTAREVEIANKYAVEKIINDFLPVLDSLEQALDVGVNDEDKEDAAREGIKLTVQLFLSTLEKHNVKQLNPLGEAFDPNQHEAMSMQPSDEAEPGTILQVFQKGYMLYERVIRPARVIVSK